VITVLINVTPKIREYHVDGLRYDQVTVIAESDGVSVGSSGNESWTRCGHLETGLPEWMDDHHPTYESHPDLSLIQWIKSRAAV
jgi:1,4-alpha-glucan branching enzyme